VSSMAARPFRFGVVATPQHGPEQWLATARRIADQGYATLLMPDGLQLLAPAPALAMAAAATPELRIGTWVYAAPLRPPRATAWEAHSLSVLTAGRFEMGIGTGRPESQRSAAQLGLPFGSPANRLAQVGEVITTLREMDGPDRHTAVVIAAGGPKARTLAAQHADTVTLAISPLTSRDTVADIVEDLRAKAGDRVTEIELAASIFIVGDHPPDYQTTHIGADLPTLRAHDSLAILPADTTAVADELQRRRDRYGLSYITVGADYADALAPVVEHLTGT
jgi:alkanesulfonate monooxygenase SsuD/methylene tetrahydromethanopterin reductase-like flavin-dependent oxidoreductase (luciferase family)